MFHIVLFVLQLQLPGYLRALPLPKTFDGFLDLTREDWLTLAPFFLTISIIIYLMITPFVNLCFSKEKRPRINRKHELNSPKVATTFDIEDLGDKKVFCRCWKSNKVSCPAVKHSISCVHSVSEYLYCAHKQSRVSYRGARGSLRFPSRIH